MRLTNPLVAAPTEPPSRVAVVLMSAIGSTVQGMPVLTSLRRAWPEAHITWILQPAAASLMDGRPDIDKIVLFHRQMGASAYPRFRRAVRSRRFDLVINLQPNFKAGCVTRLMPSDIRLGYDRARARDLSWLATNRTIPARPVAHVQDELFEFLDALGVPRVEQWDFHFTEKEKLEQRRWREKADRPLLAIVPRSSDPRKNWTIEGAARIINIARHDLGLEPILLGGGSKLEFEDAHRLEGLIAAPPRSELGGSLRQLAWRLEATDIVLAPDTGPLHMAVALETPTIGLYGYTDPKRSGPYRRFLDLLVDRHTRPGETRPTWATRPGRMKQITVEDVAEKLELAMHRYVNRGG